jgi:hypothetical protein
MKCCSCLIQVVFGDPDKGVAIPGISSDKIHTVCAASDPICYGLPIPLGAHLQYGSDTAGLTGAANFVKSKVSGGGGNARMQILSTPSPIGNASPSGGFPDGVEANEAQPNEGELPVSSELPSEA